MGATPDRRPKTVRRLRIAAALLAVVCGAVTVSLNRADEAALRTFDAAADRWQHATRFRAAALEYVDLGSRAVRAHLFGIPGRTIILTARSVPLLPERLAANSTSQAHYTAFGAGPLSAYLHLCGEQSPRSLFGAVAAAGQLTDSAAAARTVLDAFHADAPVCHDAGAVDDIATLLRDVQPRRPLTVRGGVGPLLLPHVRAVARQLGLPADPAAMTPDQQSSVLARLDAEVRATDPELWRTKQLSDTAAGVWAQVFAPQYHLLTRPLLLLHTAAEVALVALLAASAVARARQSPPVPSPGTPGES